MLVAIFLFSACSKETQTTNKTNFSNNFTSVVTQPSYTDMVLQPRQPGENFDTYEAYWNNCLIKATGPLYYDMVKYPGLLNGVPVIPNEISTYDGTSRIGWLDTPTDGVGFEVTQTYLGGLPSTGYQTDFNAYTDLWRTWVNQFFNGQNPGPEPTLASTIKTSYSGPASQITYTGKFIRVTTGSGLAIAPVSYPLPQKQSVPKVINLVVIAYDDSAHANVCYKLHGSNGNFTYADKGTVINGVFDFSSNVTVTAVGSYSQVTGYVYHYTGTITRSDGTLLPFDTTEDIS